MAEIKIEKKTPVWPWILLILVILAIIAYFLLRDDENDVDTYDDANTEIIDDTDDYQNNSLNDSTTDQNVNYNSAMSDFNASVDDSTRVGKDSVYTKTAFQKLANMVVMKADLNNLESSESLKNLRGYSMQASSTINDMGITKNLKQMGNDVTMVLQDIQKKNYPNLQSDITDLKGQADKLSNTTAFNTQEKTIRNFVMSSKEVLNSMNR
ncbi:MAG: hypothetical protein ACSHXF_15020 [Aquaticitalea sp.]